MRTVEVTPADRERLVNLLFAERAHSLLFPYADRTASVELTDPGRLRFALLSDTFPLSDSTALELWDDRGHDGFGTLDAVGFQAAGSADRVPVSALEPTVREHFDRLYSDLWRQLMAVIDYRAAAVRASLDPTAHERAGNQQAALKLRSADQRDLWSQVNFDLDQLVNSAEAGHLPLASLKGGDKTEPAAAGH
jgi:hypothetical protein